RLATRRGHRLHPTWSRPAADPLDQIGRRPKLVLNNGAANERIVHCEHADRGRVSTIPAFRLHFFFRIRVTIVEVEADGDWTAMRRKLDEDASHGLATGHHITVQRLAGDTHAERRRTRHLRGLSFRCRGLWRWPTRRSA